MMSVLGLAAMTAVALAEDSAMSIGATRQMIDLFTGSYEFEIMGTPYRLYLCEAEMSKGLYWAVANLANLDYTNEFTEVVGRDYNGIDFDGAHTYTAEASIYRLYGQRTLEGYYRLVFDSSTLTFTLHERYPQLEDGQTGALEEELWNSYELKKISPTLVGNPQMMGYQCLHPNANALLSPVPIPSLWKSELSSENDRFYDNIFVSDDPVNSCWKYEDVYGNIHLYGNIYAPEFQWDGALILLRWDDFTNPDKCYVGSMLIVTLEEDLALVSYQCENSMTGRQYLAHLQDMTGEESCPFEPMSDAELTKRETSVSNLNK